MNSVIIGWTTLVLRMVTIITFLKRHIVKVFIVESVMITQWENNISLGLSSSWPWQSISRDFSPGRSCSAIPSWVSKAENCSLSPQWHCPICGHQGERLKSDHGQTMTEENLNRHILETSTYFFAIWSLQKLLFGFFDSACPAWVRY